MADEVGAALDLLSRRDGFTDDTDRSSWGKQGAL
jgi:hypothetical protein